MRELLAVLLLVAGCHDVPGAYDFAVGLTEPYIGGSTDSSSSGMPAMRADLPQRLDLPKQHGCTKLDVLFVVDNSPSMLEDQVRLLAAVPGFISLLNSFGVGFDMHIGVTTTDQNGANPDECAPLGALVQQRWSGAYYSGEVQPCTPYSTGANYMTPEDLGEPFECAMVPGSQGSGSEQVAGAFIEALKPALSENMGDPFFGFRGDDCNAGFRREEASLLVVLLTDEDDKSSVGDPDWWADALWYLAGDQELLVVGFIPEGSCGDGSHGERLRELLGQVPSHVASICAPNYAVELAKATAKIADQCGPIKPEP